MTRIRDKYAQMEAEEKMWAEVKKAQEKMWSNAVSVRIYPINLPDTPMSEWEWEVEVTIPNNQWEGSDEDGNFFVYQQGIDAFSSLESAFQWAYRWLESRGYDVSNIDISMNSVLHHGFSHQTDYAKVLEARNSNA